MQIFGLFATKDHFFPAGSVLGVGSLVDLHRLFPYFLATWLSGRFGQWEAPVGEQGIFPVFGAASTTLVTLEWAGNNSLPSVLGRCGGYLGIQILPLNSF